MSVHDSGDRYQGMQIPVSSGIPRMVRVAFVIGIIVIFIIVGMVIANSQSGHVWPAVDSAKIKL